MSEMNNTIQKILQPGKGILAADESSPTIAKRFAGINVASTPETHQAYRELLFTTPNLNQYVAGVILYEETLNQKTQSGTPFPDLLKELGIVPGIKVDKGLVELPGTHQEKVTQGLDGLAERLAEYKTKGAGFAKWRAVYQISDNTPSSLLIHTNAHALACYAATCQSQGIVPIVEPEVLIDGNHTLERCAEVTEQVLRAVFAALSIHKVSLEQMILKPSMVIPGKACPQKATSTEIAAATMRVFRRTVPAAVPTINFLSGGQTPEEASQNLNAINQSGPQPWNLSFSYARALQAPCLEAWQGKSENIESAQAQLIERAKANSMAAQGDYSV